MLTVCPKCALSLAVTAADLRVGQGYVRCGRCSNVFNALVALSEEPPPLPEPAGVAGLSREPAPIELDLSRLDLETTQENEALRSERAPTLEDSLEFTLGSEEIGRIFVEATPGDPETGTGTFESIVLEGEGELDAEGDAPDTRAGADTPHDEPEPVPGHDAIEFDARELEDDEDSGQVREELPSQPITPEPPPATAMSAPRGGTSPSSEGEAAPPSAASPSAASPSAALRSRAAAAKPGSGTASETSGTASAGSPSESAAGSTDSTASTPAALRVVTVAGNEVPASDAHEAPDALDDPDDAAAAFERPPREGTPRERLVWSAAAAALVLLLAIQWMHFRRNDLATRPALHGALTGLYGALGLGLTPHWDLDAYEVRQYGATGGSAEGQLRVRASVKNGGAQPQPLPLLRLSLHDRFGNVVAARDLAPAEYVGSPRAARDYLGAGQRIDTEIALVDPGSEAVGFEIDACLPAGAGRLSCAGDGAPAR